MVILHMILYKDIAFSVAVGNTQIKVIKLCPPVSHLYHFSGLGIPQSSDAHMHIGIHICQEFYRSNPRSHTVKNFMAFLLFHVSPFSFPFYSAVNNLLLNMPEYYLQISLPCSTFRSQAIYRSIKIGTIYRLSSPQHVPLQSSLYGRNTISVLQQQPLRDFTMDFLSTRINFAQGN